VAIGFKLWWAKRGRDRETAQPIETIIWLKIKFNYYMLTVLKKLYANNNKKNIMLTTIIIPFTL
jgi:hypothetical protein